MPEVNIDIRDPRLHHLAELGNPMAAGLETVIRIESESPEHGVLSEEAKQDPGALIFNWRTVNRTLEQLDKELVGLLVRVSPTFPSGYVVKEKFGDPKYLKEVYATKVRKAILDYLKSEHPDVAELLLGKDAQGNEVNLIGIWAIPYVSAGYSGP